MGKKELGENADVGPPSSSSSSSSSSTLRRRRRRYNYRRRRTVYNLSKAQKLKVFLEGCNEFQRLLDKELRKTVNNVRFEMATPNCAFKKEKETFAKKKPSRY